MLLNLDVKNLLLFLYNVEQQTLEACLADNKAQGADFQIPRESKSSIVSTCYMQQSLRRMDPSGYPGIVDRQLVKYFGTEALLCLPLSFEQQTLGVIALGLSAQQLHVFEKHSCFASYLASEVARSIVIHRTAPVSVAGDESDDSNLGLRVLEAVHEARNPLTIILNYLQVLKMNLGEDHKENENLEHIKDEIERVRDILTRLRSPGKSKQSEGDLHQVIESMASIFRESLSQDEQIDLVLGIDEDTRDIRVDDLMLKQILTNLLKNAAEALSPGGKILVRTESNVSVGGESFTAIYVQDNGPGISDDVRSNLFFPMKSTKGVGHSGLGLNIVKKLVDNMHGTIVCRSNANPEKGPTGTQFQILLPHSY